MEDQNKPGVDIEKMKAEQAKMQEMLAELMKRDNRGVPPDHAIDAAQRFSKIANRGWYKSKRKPSKRNNK